MTVFATLSTSALVEAVTHDALASERELELVDRLQSAIDEVDRLHLEFLALEPAR